MGTASTMASMVEALGLGLPGNAAFPAVDGRRNVLARSAGDLRDAPHPDGASEFVDLHLHPAREAGVRYAVMVLNNYSGVSFANLERAFAGLMIRHGDEGAHFDPRTVALRFALQGENGVFLPLVVDLQQQRLHWLDVYSSGQFEFNNVATSTNAIRTVCPSFMGYFAAGQHHDGARPSLWSLGLLHGAARARVVLRRAADGTRVQRRRRDDESATDFFARLQLEGTVGDGVVVDGVPDDGTGPALALLLRGDLPLPAATQAMAIFREGVTGSIAASDLLGEGPA